MRVNAGVELDHVVVNVWLQDCCVGGANMRNQVMEGDHVEALGGVVESSVVYVVNGGGKLVACDGCNDEVGVPGLLFCKVGGSCCFVSWDCGWWIDRIVGGSGRGDGESCAVALEVKDWVLEEAKMAFAMTPGARNGHEIGGKFLLQDFEQLVCWLSVDACESGMGHLGPNGVC